MGDISIDDMFHNFMLHKMVQKWAVIYVTPFYPEELSQRKKFYDGRK